jgi:diguanylate cyclase (GGDEF)-like protein
MEDSRNEVQSGTGKVLGRVLNRDLFLFLLDLEVKRARRYQNFLCLLLLKVRRCQGNEDCLPFDICYETLSDLLSVEMRESDILGSLGGDRLVILLPYADAKAANHAKSRFEETLGYYNFESKGFEVMIDQICFPTNGTNTMDLIRRALGTETSINQGFK